MDILTYNVQEDTTGQGSSVAPVEKAIVLSWEPGDVRNVQTMPILL